MHEAVVFLSAPFAMCLILVGIHCYLGLHLLARGVIFVDLSLAQVASFGATVALLLGFEHGSASAYFISLLVTFLAAGFFAFARKHEKVFSQEALIGIIYALASAAVVLVVDRLAHGAEHIKELLVGQILWVSWHEVFKTAIIYGVVGLIHFVFRRQLLDLSHGATQQKRAFAWDFLFYALFGVVITSSSSMAGVLQVFTYLIVPAIVATSFFKTVRGRLIFGWIFGTLLSFVALGLSYRWDMPAGALIVVAFTIVPVLLVLAHPFLKKKTGIFQTAPKI
jgi:zinc/manganese transport system permease protein